MLNAQPYAQERPDTDRFAGSLNGSSSDRRRHLRHATQKPLAISRGLFKRKLKGVVVDWSDAGLCFESYDDALARKGKNAVRIKLPQMSGVTGTVVRKSPTPQGQWQYGIRFSKVLQQYEEDDKLSFRKFTVAIFTLAFIVGLGMLKIQHVRWFWYDPVFRFYTLMTAVFIGSRLLFSIFYKDYPDKNYLPSVSVIIAVKNEEAHIGETIERCFKSNYPKDRFEVIVIDDGSTDNTWQVLEDFRRGYPQLRTIKFPENKGKRHGMAAGAMEAKGDVLVYVDSDSFVEPEGIYRLVQPFSDPTIGAVAGHTKVAIEADNVISKMESVRYFISHQIFKSSEALFGAVTCCPGAFSAYRRELVLEVLPAWLNQTFLGVKATFGDDRSLTNYILRNYQVFYQSNAVCFTYVPRKWMQFFRQQLRWKKSWVREATVASRIMYKKHPFAAFSYYMGTAITFISPIVFLRAIVYGPLVLGAPLLPYLYGVFLVYLALCLYYFLYTHDSFWYCGMLFAFVYMVVLCWQTYYAIVTVNHTHWGTR